MPAKRFTADDLWELSLTRDDGGKFLELMDGVIYENSPAYARPSIMAARLGYYLLDHVQNHNVAGYVSAATGGYMLSEYDVLAPKTAYISKERQPDLSGRYFQAAPDLSVEIVSPTNAIKNVKRKAQKYLEYRHEARLDRLS